MLASHSLSNRPLSELDRAFTGRRRYLDAVLGSRHHRGLHRRDALPPCGSPVSARQAHACLSRAVGYDDHPAQQ